MKLRRKQRGFLLNPYRFAGSTQSAEASVTSTATATFSGSGVVSAAVSSDSAATLEVIGSTTNTASTAISSIAEASATLVGASLAGAAVNGSAAGNVVLASESLGVAVDAADFDGTNDYLTRGSFTGQADSRKGVLSAWILVDTTASLQDLLSCVKADSTIVLEFSAMRSAGTGPRIFMGDSIGTILQMDSTISLSAGTWYHLLASWDVSISASHLYINDVDRKNVTAGPNNRDVPMGTTQEWSVGAYSPFDGNGLKVNGGIAELYFAPGQYLDFSTESNRRKFITSTGKPTNLGATGSTPTGSVPLIYLHLDNGETANNFATNRTANGNLTVTGALSTYASSPSD